MGSFDGAATSTSNLGDSIDGGAGTDTVRIVSNANNTAIPSLSNVENLHLVDIVHETRDMSTFAGVTGVELEGGTTIAAGTLGITLGTTQSLTLDSIIDGDAANDGANQGGVTIATGGADTSLDLTLDGVGAQSSLTTINDLDLDLTGTGLTTLNVTATGVNNISLANTGAALATLNVAGAGSLTVQGTTAATITTFNASTNTGGVTVDLSASTGANQTITGSSTNDTLGVDLQRNITLDAGAGNDLVTLANPAAANLSSTTGAADAIKGGAGTDTLAMTAAGAVALAGDAAADRGVITEFEQLRVTNDLNNSTFDISAFGFNYLQVGADITTAAATVNGFTSGATVEFRDANATAANQLALNVGMTGATGAGTPNDTLNLMLNDDLVNQATAGAQDGESIEIEVGVAGINKLNVSTADRSNTDGATSRDDGYRLTLANDNNVDTLTVTGTNELAFTSTAATAALQTVAAAGLSGDLILNLATNGLTQGVTVTGGSGANTITGTQFADIITGGGRADALTLGAGVDKVTGGAGADTFTVAAADYTAASAAALASAADEITDFGKATDIIDWDANLVVVQNGTAVTGTAAINAEGIAAFVAADDTLIERITAVEAGINAGGAATDGQFAIFEHGGNSYVFISEGTDGVGAGDALIKLTGVTGLADSTINGANDLIIA